MGLSKKSKQKFDKYKNQLEEEFLIKIVPIYFDLADSKQMKEESTKLRNQREM